MNYIASLYKTRCHALAEQIENVQRQIAILETREYDEAPSPLLVSTRVPTSKRQKIDPHTLVGQNRLVVGMEPMEDEQIARLADVLRGQAISGPKPSKNPEKVIADVTGRVKRNVEFGLERAESLPELAKRSQMWYVGANNIANRFGKRFNHAEHVMAGVLAALSPQKDWYQNASLGERVIKIHTHHANDTWTPEMDVAAQRFLKQDKKAHQAGYNAIRGKTLSQISDPVHAAMWVRAFDEAHHPRHYRVITPEGDFAEHSQTQTGKRSTAAWGSFKEIGNAIKILRSNGNIEEISRALGNQHKVRSFFNNIMQPNNPSDPDVTIDTHAIGSSLANPQLAGSSKEVSIGLGGSPKSSITGIGGTYPMFADVMRDVGRERGMVANAVQSVTWDEKRASVPAKGTGVKKRKASVDDAWKRFKAGDMSHEEVLAHYGEMFPAGQLPTWANAKPQNSVSTFESVNRKINKFLKYITG